MIRAKNFLDKTIKAYLWVGMAAVLSLITACGGKVADLSESSASVSSITIVSTELTGVVVGQVSSMISTSGGVPPLNFTVSGGTLPEGLKLAPTTGMVSGVIPASAANQSYATTISVTDSAGLTATRTFSGTVSAGNSILTFQSQTIADFTAGISYSYPLVILGGEKPYSFKITTGGLPSGVSIDPVEGTLTGTPANSTANQAFAFEVTVEDASKQKKSRTFSGSVGAGSALLRNYSNIVADFVAGVSYSYPLVVTGGTAPYTFAVTTGAAPSGISLNTSTGVISGTPAASSGGTSYAFQIRVTDASGQTSEKTYSGTVGAGSALLTNRSPDIAQFVAGIQYFYPIVVTGGTTPYSYSISSGALPTGISLNVSTGLLSGTTSAAIGGQAFAFSLQVADAGGQTATRTYIGNVLNSNASSFNIITGTLPAPSAGSSYGASIGVSGGAAPYTFAISAGALPSGLSLNTANGLISGTVAYSAQGAAYLFSVTASDSTSLTSTVQYSGFVSSYATSLLPATMPAATPGQGYNVSFTTVNGQAPYTYSITSGTLPSGLSLNPTTGIINGTVAESEAGLTKSFSVRSQDTNGITRTENYSILTNNFDVTLLTNTLAQATEGTAYNNSSTALSASGGSAPYTYEFTGSLPSGVGLTNSGTFFGTPASGTGAFSVGTDYTVYVRARDNAGRPSALKTFNLSVIVTSPAVNADTLANAVLGSSYSQTLTATGGRPPYVFAVTAGTLPTGLSLSSSGVLSGSAAASATCPTDQFTVRVTDFLNNISAASLKCVATVNGVSVSNTSFPVVNIGVSYLATITATGGTPPYTFSQTGLPLPSLVPSTGVISGFTNSSSGDYTSFLTVTDSSTPPLTNTRSYVFTVRNPLAIGTTPLPRAATSFSYNGGSGHQLASSGGQSPYTYQIVSGSLPSGLSMSSSGLISGTPAYFTAANGGSYPLSITSTDALGQTTSAASFTLNVSVGPKIKSPILPTPSVTDPSLPSGVVGTPYAVDIEREGGSNQFNGASLATRLSYSASGLPAGLSIGTTTGRIFGTPSTATGSPFTVQVSLTDEYGFVATKTFALIIRTAGKNLDLKAARFSDPCPAAGTNCAPGAHDIAQLNNDTQQFLVYSRTDTNPRSIQIAKIDSQGRIQRPVAGNNLTTNIALNASFTSFGQLRIDDMDQDGRQDIVFTDTTFRKLCIMWNGFTVNTYGMPTGFSVSNMDCFPIPNGANAANSPGQFIIRSDLRPDSTNYGKRDIVVTATQNGNNPGNIYVLKNICALNGACTNATTQRPVIFDAFGSMTATTAVSTTVTVASTTGLVPGMTVVGNNIPANVTIATVPNGTTFTLSAAATVAGATRITFNKATTYFSASLTSGNAVIPNAASTAGLYVGQLVHSPNFPAGTRISSFVTNGNITATANSTATSTVLVGFSDLTSYVPLLLSDANSNMRNMYNIRTGWFIAQKPDLAGGTRATSVNQCPGIAVSGTNGGAGRGYVYVLRQSYSGGCLGDFQTHVASDEFWAQTGTNAILNGLEAEDFNNDGYTDIAVGSNLAGSNSASLFTYLSAGTNAFTGGTSITSQIQSRGTGVWGINKVQKYCLDGTSNCSYPGLAVTCAAANPVAGGCLAILPNQCSTSGCTTPFESSTASNRIDYSGPNGQNQELILKPLVSTGRLSLSATTNATTVVTVSPTTNIGVGQAVSGTNIQANSYVVSKTGSDITLNQAATGSGAVTLTIPTVPTLLDIAYNGVDLSAANYSTYFLTYARNGSSTADPLKAPTMLDGFPSTYQQNADIGVTKLVDGNGDNKLDLYTFSPNQSFVGTFMSSSSGGVAFDLKAGAAPNYLSEFLANGCPSSAVNCYPDPIFNPMGAQMGYPSAGFFDDRTMALEDINNDGNPDVVTAGYVSRGVSVALGNSSGQFSIGTFYQMGSGVDLKPRQVLFSDLDQDGIKDLVIAGQQFNPTATGVASWLKGNGDGTFQTPISINQVLNSCTDPRSLAAVDIDLDGRPELAVLCYTGQTVWISRRHTDGSWVLQSTVSGSVNNAAGQVNGLSFTFGRLTTSGATGIDMALVGQDPTNSMRIITNLDLNITNASTGAFQVSGLASTFYTLYGHPADVEIADLNADGLGDIITTMQRHGDITATTGSAYYSCQSVSTGVCNLAGWGMEGVGTSSVSIGELTEDDTPELVIGYQGVGRLIFRTISRVLNLSQ